MTTDRRMQVRDVTTPIEAVCRQFLEERGIPAIYLHELTRPLLDEIHALLDRHGAEVRREDIADGQAATRAYEEGIFDAGVAEGLRQSTEGPSTWEVRGYLADYGPYASLTSSSGYSSADEARAYFNTIIDDTHAALVLLVEVRGGWERVVDRWRPDAEALAFEREMDAERLVGPWEPAEQPEPEEARLITDGHVRVAWVPQLPDPVLDPAEQPEGSDR